MAGLFPESDIAKNGVEELENKTQDKNALEAEFPDEKGSYRRRYGRGIRIGGIKPGESPVIIFQIRTHQNRPGAHEEQSRGNAQDYLE